MWVILTTYVRPGMILQVLLMEDILQQLRLVTYIYKVW